MLARLFTLAERTGMHAGLPAHLRSLVETGRAGLEYDAGVRAGRFPWTFLEAAAVTDPTGG